MAIPLIFCFTLIIASIATFFLHKFTRRNKNKKFPPGPKGLPILGHLHMLGKNPHQDLHKIAQKYGPIMYMQFGIVRNIIVSSPRGAELFLKTYDLTFASRPPCEASKHMAWDQTSIIFAPYGVYWRNIRKLCTLELLSTSKISSFQPMRKEELSLLVEFLTQAAKESDRVDMSDKISSLTMDMSCRMVFGKKYEDKDVDERGFKSLIQEGVKVAAVPNLAEYLPFIGILDLQGLTKKMRAIGKMYDNFFESIIEEHVRTGDDGKTKDIVNTILSIMASGETDFQFNRNHVKSIMLDMLGASMDTTAAAIEWTLSELIKNPHIMKMLQKELENVVGLDRMVEESDLDKLKYLNLIIKETFRLHPVAPLLIPHYSMEDCMVDGYDIPKESRVIINTYAIGRDPSIWNDPDKFLPERFLGSNVDVMGQHFQLLPFGSGRRGCPGMQLGLIQVQLIVSQLVHCFDWQLPDNMLPEELDMAEEFGLVVARENHLVLVPSLRLQYRM